MKRCLIICIFLIGLASLSDGQQVRNRFNVTRDTSGIIWAYTTSGKIFMYNQLSDRFELTIDLQEEIEINKTGHWVYTLFFIKSNTLWIGTTAGTMLTNNK